MLALARGRFPFQIFTAFLERGFNGPALRVTLHNLLRVQCDIGRKEIFVTMGPCTIMDIHPSSFDEGFTNPVPVTGAGDHLNVSGCPPIPCHREA